MSKRTKADPNAPPPLDIAYRQAAAYALYVQGGTDEQIAEQIRQLPGAPARYTKLQAFNDVQAVIRDDLARLPAHKDNHPAHTHIQLDRLNQMFAAIWPYAIKGDPGSINIAMKLMGAMDAYRGLFPKDEAANQPRGASMAGGSATPNTELPRITEIVVEVGGTSTHLMMATDPARAQNIIDITPEQHGGTNGTNGTNGHHRELG